MISPERIDALITKLLEAHSPIVTAPAHLRERIQPQSKTSRIRLKFGRVGLAGVGALALMAAFLLVPKSEGLSELVRLADEMDKVKSARIMYLRVDGWHHRKSFGIEYQNGKWRSEDDGLVQVGDSRSYSEYIPSRNLIIEHSRPIPVSKAHKGFDSNSILGELRFDSQAHVRVTKSYTYLARRFHAIYVSMPPYTSRQRYMIEESTDLPVQISYEVQDARTGWKRVLQADVSFNQPLPEADFELPHRSDTRVLTEEESEQENQARFREVIATLHLPAGDVQIRDVTMNSQGDVFIATTGNLPYGASLTSTNGVSYLAPMFPIGGINGLTIDGKALQCTWWVPVDGVRGTGELTLSVKQTKPVDSPQGHGTVFQQVELGSVRLTAPAASTGVLPSYIGNGNTPAENEVFVRRFELQVLDLYYANITLGADGKPMQLDDSLGYRSPRIGPPDLASRKKAIVCLDEMVDLLEKEPYIPDEGAWKAFAWYQKALAFSDLHQRRDSQMALQMAQSCDPDHDWRKDLESVQRFRSDAKKFMERNGPSH